ncbi:MAG TPA: hypothetical protein VFH92_00940 [Phenylobacterium sp.]|nr:hypothetical protein [Phenylobacterium sp.]
METQAHFGDQTGEVVTHERTYHAFSLLTRWAMLVLGDTILTLTLWFATGAGFWGAFVVGLIVFVVGYYLLIRHEEKQPLDVWTEGR